MPNAAEMELIIRATVDQSVRGISQVNQQLDKTVSSAAAASGAMAKASTGINSVATTATKASSALTQQASATADIANATNDAASNASKLAGIVDAGSKQIIESNSVVAKSYDEVSGSINQFAEDFNSKWTPVVEQAQKDAEVFEKIPQSLEKMGQGFQTNDVSANLAAMAVAAGATDSAIDQLVQQTASFLKLDQSVRQLLLSIEGLDPEIRQFAQDGQGSIAQLTAAFNVLKEKATFTTNPHQLLNYNLAIEQLGKQINNAKTAASQFSPALSKINPAANSANFALTNFGRILQDLPFGFVGISNNLVPFQESLRSLQATAKQTGTTLTSALLSSLTSSGGIGLAFSAVSAAITVATFGLSAWTRGFGNAKAAVDEATKANEEYKKTLEDIGNTAIKNSEKEITSVQLLVNAAHNNTLSINERIAAVEKLQAQFPQYFGSLSKEQILYSALTKEINLTTEALLNKAFAESASNKAAEAGARVFDLLEKRRVATEALNAAQSKYNTAIANPQIGQGIVGFQKALQNAQENLDKINGLFFQAQLDQASFLFQAQKYGVLSQGIASTGDALSNVSVILRKLNDDISEINRKSVLTGADFSTDKISAYKKAIDELSKIPIDTTQIKQLQSSIDALLKAGVGKDSEIIRNIQNQIKQLDPASGAIDDLSKKLKELGGSIGDASKLNEIDKILEKLIDDRTSLSKNPMVLNLDKPLKDIELIQSAIEKLRELKAPEAIIVKLQTEIDNESLAAVGGQLQKKFNDLKNFQIPEITFPAKIAPIKIGVDLDTDETNQLKGKVELLSQLLHIELPVNFESLNKDELQKILDAIPTDVKIKLGIDADKTGFKNFIKNLTDSQNALEDLNKSIANIAVDTLTDAFTNFGKALGSGGNPFSALFQSFAKGLEELGATLIRYGVIHGIMEKALKAAISNPLGGILAISAGIALEALGSLLESKVHFAEGGITTAPVLGLVGERGREAIIPLDRLNEFINRDGQAIDVTIKGELSGDKLKLLVDRVNRRFGRTY